MDAYRGPKSLISGETYCQTTAFISSARCSCIQQSNHFYYSQPSENLCKRAATTCPLWKMPIFYHIQLWISLQYSHQFPRGE